VRRITLFTLLAMTSCQLVGGYAEFDYDTTPTPPPEHPCDVLDETKVDERNLAVSVRVDLRDGTCLWVDRTEVTVEQYTAWQEAVPAGGPDGPKWEETWCRWKTERSDPIGDLEDACRAEILRYDTLPFGPTKPMRCVDFCEAEAFCRWMDKHLCYDQDGIGAQGPRLSPQEWRLTCTNQQTTVYPWGNETESVCNVGQDPEACVGVIGPTCGPLPVGQKPQCKTPSGVMDLLGNVAEWTYSCNYVDSTEPLEPTVCMTRGGGYDEPLGACEIEGSARGDRRAPSLGFRCCANLTQRESELVGITPR